MLYLKSLPNDPSDPIQGPETAAMFKSQARITISPGSCCILVDLASDCCRRLTFRLRDFRRVRIVDKIAMERAVFPVHHVASLIVPAFAHGFLLGLQHAETHRVPRSTRHQTADAS